MFLFLGRQCVSAGGVQTWPPKGGQGKGPQWPRGLQHFPGQRRAWGKQQGKQNAAGLQPPAGQSPKCI
eukprot:7608426-Lingulodinium_polyedra.AAC.1